MSYKWNYRCARELRNGRVFEYVGEEWRTASCAVLFKNGLFEHPVEHVAIDEKASPARR
jgi:hypothetical protein